MKYEQIISRPIVTERASAGEAIGKYTFKVSSDANKVEIRKAIEKIFSTKVKSVNILNTKPKMRRRGRTIGKVSGFKKAIVTLEKGQSIKITEEKKEKKTAAKVEKEKKVEEKK